MTNPSAGIHHITCISGDGQRNADFYVSVLGLRLILKSVNQDDPSTYHLFYANGAGQPGSSLTFFPWPMAAQGKPGSGEAVAVSFAVPSDSVEYWAGRFAEHDIDFDGPFERFDRQVLGFHDPDRMRLELAFDPGVNDVPVWSESTVPEEHGIRGFWGTTLRLDATDATAELLDTVFGFESVRADGDSTLHQTGSTIGSAVILERAGPQPGRFGRGTIHHVAFRAADEADQRAMRAKVIERGLSPTEVIDRHVFRSVYFRSPGGVLFEIATDGPGYKTVQDEEDLGRKLFLPPWLESRREKIERRLPEITV